MSEENMFLEEKDKSSVDKQDEVIVMSKVTFNYILIAITFLLVGIAIGLFGINGGKNTGVNETQLRAVLISVLQDSNLNFGNNGEADRFEFVDDDPYLGNEDAPIVIVEFSDFFCTYCKRHFDLTLMPILENYGEYIRYVYRDFAQLTAESQPAAMAAECAHEQGKFWEFHNEFFNNQSELGHDFYIATAQKYELDMDEYTACLDEGRYQSEVGVDRLDGFFNGVQGTPGFFINGQFISGAQPYELFELIIQKELNQAGISYEVNTSSNITPIEAESTVEANADDSNDEQGRPQAEVSAEATEDTSTEDTD